jgi:Flp pilus assembly protein TadG
LIEFAIVFPLLVLLLVGIVEFGWLFAQYVDVRHGAREGVRLATVNFPEGSDPPVMTRTQANTATLLDEACSRMSTASGAAVTFTSLGDVGDSVTVRASAPANTLSGLIDWAIPDTLTLNSTVILHAEQEATWANTDVGIYPNGQPCP